MTTINSLYFPGTTLYSAKQYPLFLLPIKLCLIQPVEDMPFALAEDVHDSFIKNDYCQGYTPSPLGEHKQRFLQLVNDIKHRKDDYAAQLSQLTIAAMSSPKTDKSETKGGIISSLLGKDILVEDNGQEAELWQARLTLVLAEMVDIEEEDLSRNLSILDDLQDDIFQDLQGDPEEEEEDNPFADLLQQQKLQSATGSTNSSHRMHAWQKLYANSADEIRDIKTFVTDNKDAAEKIIDSFHNFTGASIAPIMTLEIPAITDWDETKSLQEIADFRSTNKEILATVADVFSGGSHETNDIKKRWVQTIDLSFPTDISGRVEADIYQLPQTPFSDSKEPCTLIYIKS